MRSLVLWITLAACAEDYRPSPVGSDCPEPTLSIDDRCGEALCGNGQVDACWRENLQAHCPMWGVEACDGEMTCEQAGFYGPALACNNCNVDTRECDACGPGARRCELITNSPRAVATNGTQVAVAQGSRVTWFDSELREVATRTFDSSVLVTAVSGGWLVAELSKLTFVDETFAIGTSTPLVQSEYRLLSPVANGRVLVVWRDADSSYLVGAIASEQGTIEVPAKQLVFGYSVDDVTTDGTNFFVASGGTLVKVTPTGTTTIDMVQNPGGTLRRSLITWSGNGGVFAVAYGESSPLTTLTRFDAAGAPVGDTVSVPVQVFDMIPDGANVLALTDGKVTLTTIDPTTGTTTVGKEVGAGHGERRLARLGSEIVVAWDRDVAGTSHHIAIAAP